MDKFIVRLYNLIFQLYAHFQLERIIFLFLKCISKNEYLPPINPKVKIIRSIEVTKALAKVEIAPNNDPAIIICL